jgi:hypothetical protein
VYAGSCIGDVEVAKYGEEGEGGPIEEVLKSSDERSSFCRCRGGGARELERASGKDGSRLREGDAPCGSSEGARKAQGGCGHVTES